MDQLHTKFNNKSVNSFVSLKIIPIKRCKIVVEVSYNYPKSTMVQDKIGKSLNS